MNLLEEIEKVKAAGYNEINAQARICQDIRDCQVKCVSFLGIVK